MNLVKNRSYEHYLTSLLLPDNLQRCSFAVRALNAEVAGIQRHVSNLILVLNLVFQISSVRDSVTTKHAGVGRMVFWRETIKEICDKGSKNPIPKHPVVLELHWAVKQARIFD